MKRSGAQKYLYDAYFLISTIVRSELKFKVMIYGKNLFCGLLECKTF